MCNSINHSPDCRCGFGGEGHLGRRTFGNNASVLSNLPSFWTFNPKIKVHKTRRFQSYINPNAHCPVCGDDVYFYQSPHGGRVFFDDIGYPWTKHPCTDSNLWRTSTQKLKFIGNEENELVIYFIHKWEEEGYFPMICRGEAIIPDRKGVSIIGKFLYDNIKVDKYLRNNIVIDLDLEKIRFIENNSLFFIKDIDSSKGHYELKFCFRQQNRRIKIQTIRAQIENSCRPFLKNGRIQFRDFGIKIIKSTNV